MKEVVRGRRMGISSGESITYVNAKLSRLAITGDSDGLVFEIVQEPNLKGLDRNYNTTFRGKSSVGHVITTEGGKTYTLMPNDAFNLAIPKGMENERFTYKIYVKKIIDSVTDARTGTTTSSTITTTSSTMRRNPPFISNTVSFGTIGNDLDWSQLIDNPFDGFTPRKRKSKKEEEIESKETSEELERKLSEFGKRKISIG